MGENTRQHKKSYDELGFTDDYLFCRILMENEDLCIELAEMITGRTIKSILRTETQKSVQLSYDGKGIRFDVYFEDEENVVYDIEMQAVKKYDLSKRSRYYQGMVDLNVLSKGDGYDTLKDSYIIFICTFDEFGSGRHIYSFENLCIEDPQIRLHDGSHKVFLCAGSDRNDCSEKMKDFLDYIAGRKTSGNLSKRLQKEVEKSKSQDKWRLEYMTLLEKYKEEYQAGIEEGRIKGRAEGADRKLIQQICRKLRKGKTPAQIAEELEEDEIRVKVICDMAEEYAPLYDEEKVTEAVLAQG